MLQRTAVDFGELVKHIPFYAQVWYDDHTADETESYSAEDARDISAYEAGFSNTQRG